MPARNGSVYSLPMNWPLLLFPALLAAVGAAGAPVVGASESRQKAGDEEVAQNFPPATATDANELIPGQRQADPRAFVEALLAPELDRAWQEALMQPGCGLYSLAPWLPRGGAVRFEASAARWAVLREDEDLELGAAAQVQADHAVLSLESPQFGVRPLCLLRGPGGWLLAPDLFSFAGADWPLDQASQARLQESLDALAAAQQAAAGERNARWIAAAEQARKQDQDRRENQNPAQTDPSGFLEDAAAALFFAQDDRAARERAATRFADIWSARSYRLGMQDPEVWSRVPYLALDGVAEVVESPQFFVPGLIGTPESFAEHAQSQPGAALHPRRNQDDPAAAEWRLPLLLLPESGTAGEPHVAALIAQKRGETLSLVATPQQFSSLSSRRADDNPEQQRNQLLVKMIQGLRPAAAEAPPAGNDPAALVAAWQAALNRPDLTDALSLSALAIADPLPLTPPSGVTEDTHDARLSEARFEAQRLVSVCDRVRRTQFGAESRELARSADGQRAVFVFTGLHRGFPTQASVQPLGLSRHSGRWRLDMSALDDPELAEALARAVAEADPPALLGRSLSPRLAAQPAWQPTPPPAPGTRPQRDAAPIRLWTDFTDAWNQQDLDRLAACFAPVPGHEAAGLAQLRILLECLGHPSHQIALEGIHRSGDWAAMTCRYTLPEGHLILSLFAQRQADGRWRWVLPSLVCTSPSSLSLLRNIAEAWSPAGSAAALWQEPGFQQLRHPGFVELSGQ